MASLYKILGVSRHDGDAQIKQAYRRLVKQLHPDLHPNDAAIGDRFKDVSRAYAILSDPHERARYDRGEIDTNGAHRRPFKRSTKKQRSHAATRPFEPFEMGATKSGSNQPSRNGGDVFQRFFRAGKSAPKEDFEAKRGDHSYEITVSFFEAARGITRRISLRNGKTVDVEVPPGTDTGQALRLRGQGEAAIGGASAGDALIVVTVSPHEVFAKLGCDVRIELPVSAEHAQRGGKIRVPTLDGAVTMTLPRGSASGTVLRLKGKGIANGTGGGRGDQHVYLSVIAGDSEASIDNALAS